MHIPGDIDHAPDPHSDAITAAAMNVVRAVSGLVEAGLGDAVQETFAQASEISRAAGARTHELHDAIGDLFERVLALRKEIDHG